MYSMGRRVKSSPFKALSESIESRVDELSLKGGPGSGRHPGAGKEPKTPTGLSQAHGDAAAAHGTGSSMAEYHHGMNAEHMDALRAAKNS